MTSGRIANSNIMAKYKLKNIPVYSTQDKKNIVVKSTGNNISIDNIYTQTLDGETVKPANYKSEATYKLDNAYVRYYDKNSKNSKNSTNYYYLKDKSSQNQLVKIDFSTAKGFNTTDKTKPIYPKSGIGYICVKNNEFQYGWQKITVDGKENYYYFDEVTGLAVTNKVVKLKREIDDKGNVCEVTSKTKENYYYLGSKGECLTGFHEVTINKIKNTYYFVKGNNNVKNKGKLYDSTNGKFLDIGEDKYWIEKDGSLSKTTDWHKVTIDGKESTYYLKDGKVQTGFVSIDNKDYYFVKGSVNIENKGKLYTSTNGKFLDTNNNKTVYFINPDGSKNTKSSLTFEGEMYYFDKSGVCSNPPSSSSN